MKRRIDENHFKALVFAILLIGILLQTQIAGAQRRTSMYRGFMVDFGARTFGINSNISAIDETSGVLSGGQVGVVLGNRVLRSKIGLFGYYSSGKDTPGTIDLYNMNASVNFYPMALIKQESMLIEPYFTAGLDCNYFKFFGYYTDAGGSNYSQAEAPFLGKVNQGNVTLGGGLEIRLMDDLDFVHLFTEVRYTYNILATASSQTFDNTSIGNQTEIRAGFTFGMNR